MNGLTPICPYCSRFSKKVTGGTIYPDLAALAGLNNRIFYLCAPCNAYVGCHPGTDKPLGSLADAELRRWRQKAHAALDPLWQFGPYSRTEIYGLLADYMGLSSGDCHIGYFGIAECQTVSNLMEALRIEDAADENLATVMPCRGPIQEQSE